MQCRSCKSRNIISAGYYRFQCLKCGMLSHFDSREVASTLPSSIDKIAAQQLAQDDPHQFLGDDVGKSFFPGS